MEPLERKQSLALESWRALRILSEFVDGVETMSRYPAGVAVFGSARLKPSHAHASDSSRMFEHSAPHTKARGGTHIALRELIVIIGVVCSIAAHEVCKARCLVLR